MACPLSPTVIGAVVQQMDPSFTTHDFIAACPQSGGVSTGAGCPAVQATRSRAVCGRALARWQVQYPSALSKGVQRSPALWQKGACTAQEAMDAGPVRGRSGWKSAMLEHQIRWKQDTAGVAACGWHDGTPRDYLFPWDAWTENLLSHHRGSIRRHVERHHIGLHTFAHHVLSSQCFAFNLAGPFLDHPALLTDALRRLLPKGLAEQVVRVTRVELEFDGGDPGFGESMGGRRGENRTSVDIAVWWEDRAARTSLVLVEVKFTETEFGGCSKGAEHGGRCGSDGAELVRTRGQGCPLTVPPHRRTYWQLAVNHGLFRWDVWAAQKACPFRHDGYQLMRNQLLARVLERAPAGGLHRVDFAAMVHDHNPSIRRLGQPFAGERSVETAWRGVLTDPSRFHFWRASDWLGSRPDDAALSPWHAAMWDRYFPSVS